MRHTEENYSKVSSGRVKNILVFFILVAIVMGIVFFSYLKNQDMELKDFSIQEFFSNIFSQDNPNKEAQVVGNFKFSTESHPLFNIYKDHIIKATKDDIEILNQKGETQWSKMMSVNNPVLKAAGNCLLAFDGGGRLVCSFNGDAVKWIKNIDTSIINADINKDGYVAIVKEIEGYKAAVEVYDPQGSLIFTTVRSEYFIIDAKVMPSDNELLLNMVDASGVSAGTRFGFLDMQGNEKAHLVEKSIVFPTMYSAGNSKAIAISDKKVVCFSNKGKEFWSKDYDNVFSSVLTSGDRIALAVKGNSGNLLEGNTTNIEIYSLSGSKIGGYEAKGDVIKVSSYSNIIAANAGKKIYFIDTRGKLVKKYTSKTEIKDLYFINKKEVAVISANSVILIKI